MNKNVTAQQKETARAYLRRAFSAWRGRWMTMEELKELTPTPHGIRALCTRGDEAVHAGELINRYRPGKNYKEWTWFGRGGEQFFFYRLKGAADFSPLFASYSDMYAQLRGLVSLPGDQAEIFCGSHESPQPIGQFSLPLADLYRLGYDLCRNCGGIGRLDHKTPCPKCMDGWAGKEGA